MESQRSATMGSRRQPALAVAGRLVAVLALTFGWLLSAAPAGAQAGDGLDGDTYTSERYGWSVEFDDEVWEDSEEIDDAGAEGVSLNTGAFDVIAVLLVQDDGITDAEECQENLEDVFTSSREWDDVEPATRLDPPQTAAGAAGTLYTGTFTLENESTLDLALYLECREVEDATLSISVTAVEDGYEDNLPTIEDLLAGIETGESANQDDDPSPDGPVDRGDDPTPEETDDRTPDPDLTPENDPPVLDHKPEDQIGVRDDAELDDGSYFSEVGYSLTWDPDLYEGETAEDPGAGVLLENADSGATFEVAAFEDPAIEDCIDAEVNRIRESADFVSVSISNGIRPPTSVDDAVGRMLRATEDTTQQQRKIIYVECRPLLDEGDDGDPVFLVVRAISDDEDFRKSRTEFEAMLASISIGDEPAPEPTATEEPDEEPTERPRRTPTEEPEDEEPTPRPRRTPTAESDDGPSTQDLGETDLDAGIFVGQRVPFKVEWDTAYWEVEEVDDQGLEGIRITTDQGAFGSILSANTPPDFDMESCLVGFIENWGELTPDLTQIEPEANAQLDLPDGSGSVYGAGTFTFDNGTTATLIHAGGCVELEGGGFLIIQIQIFDPVYAENLAAFNEVLASLEFGEGGGQIGAVRPWLLPR